MNRRTILVMAVLSAVSLGCARGETVSPSATVLPSPTKFFSTFSMPDLVGRHESLWKELCSSAGGGGGGPAPEAGRTQRRKSDGFGCRVNETVGEKFNEREKAFLESLKSDIEQQISGNGAKVEGAGGTSPAGFYFEYSEGGVKGRIEFISERKGGNYYLNVELIEGGKD